MLTFRSDHTRPGRVYRVTDPGDSIRLARVEFARDGQWREAKSYTTRALAHYLAHGRGPDGGTTSRVRDLAAAATVIEPPKLPMNL
jgi:hypothetical protein